MKPERLTKDVDFGAWELQMKAFLDVEKEKTLQGKKSVGFSASVGKSMVLLNVDSGLLKFVDVASCTSVETLIGEVKKEWLKSRKPANPSKCFYEIRCGADLRATVEKLKDVGQYFGVSDLVVRQRLLEILPTSLKTIGYLEVARQPHMDCNALVELLGIIPLEESLEMCATTDSNFVGAVRQSSHSGRMLGAEAGNCFYCKSPGHFKSQCPKLKCFGCGGFGHTKKFCRMQKKLISAAVCTTHTAANVFVNVAGVRVRALLDSGSNISFVSKEQLSLLEDTASVPFRLESLAQRSWVAVNGDIFSSNAAVRLQVETEDISKECFLYVIDSPVGIILGLDSLKKLGCVINFQSGEVSFVGAVSSSLSKKAFVKLFKMPENWTEAQLNLLKELLWKFREIFSLSNTDFGKTTLVEHEIDTGDSEPIYVRPFRRSLAEEEEIKKEVQDMYEAGVIESSTSPWCFPVLRVPKKDGTKRFSIDFRKLNAVTRQDRFPLPNIDSLLDRLSGAKMFSTLDIAAAYWNVPLAEKSKEKTAFQAGNRLHQFKVMPFGLSGAPATFQRFLLNVIGDLELIPYLDDIIIPSFTVEEHLLKLEAVFNRIMNAQLKLKPSKCLFGQVKIDYLGYTVSNGRLLPNADKVKGITQFETPTDSKGVQTFLGMCQFYARFIKDYATLAIPLYKLQCIAKSKFKWSAECQEAFVNIKKAFAAKISLTQPDFNRRFCIACDASDAAVGAVLYQDGDDPPVSFASRKLTAAEVNYSTTDKEFMALVWAVKKFRPYVYGTNFKVFTDHKPLLAMVKNKKAHNGRQARYQMDLEEYTFELCYRAGHLNVVADALSRSVKSGEEVEIQRSLEISAAISVPELDWRELQLSDSFCADILKSIESGHVKSGYNCDSRGILRYYGRVVIPTSQVQKMILLYHNQGHFSPIKTRSVMLGAGYWFPRMRSVISEKTENCTSCSRRSYQQFKAPTISLPKAPEVQLFQFVAIDIVGPLPVAKSGYSYVLTIIDHASRWLEAIPMTNIRAETCAKAFVNNWIFRYGPPSILHSDRGAQFLSDVFVQIREKFGIDKSVTTPYHPEGNAIIERVHRTLKDRLRASEGDWLSGLQNAVYDVNRMSSAVGGPSAHEIVFGKVAKLPADWSGLGHSEEKFFGPAVGRYVAKKVGFRNGSLQPRYIGRFLVVKRPSSHVAYLNDGSSINIRNLRLVS